MIIDNSLVFAENQAITAAATTPTQNIYDTKVAADFGIGEETTFYAKVNTALVGGTNVQALIQTSADNSTWTTVYSGPVVATAALTKGATLAKVRLPMGLQRYIRGAFTSTGTYTAGSVDAFLLADVDALQYLKSGTS